MVFHKDGVDAMVTIYNELGKYAADKGLVLCFHPHAMTCLYRDPSIIL